MNKGSISTTSALRRNNRNRMVRYLSQQNSQVTKQQLATDLSMSMPTVHQNLAELAEEDLICYTKPLESSGGRRPMGIKLNKNARISIGFSVSARYARLIAVNLQGEELCFHRYAVPFSLDMDYIQKLADIFSLFTSHYQLEEEKILGVTITVPGLVDEENLLVNFVPTFQTKQVDLSPLRGKIPHPIHLENDANAAAYGEWWQRKSLSNMAYLLVERGVGGSVLIEKSIYYGTENRSCEFGHMTIVPQGDPCTCGQKGCLEAYCSTDRLSYDNGVELHEFFQELESGNPKFVNCFQIYLDHLAQGLNLIHTVLNCPIVLGGNLSQYMEAHLVSLQDRLAKISPFQGAGDFVQLGLNPAKAAAIGGALFNISHYIQTIEPM